MTANAERLSRGENVGVDIAAIEREFAALWRSASAESADGTVRAVTRACFATLLAWCESDDELTALKAAFDTLVVSMPARVIILKIELPRAGADEFESYISANCIVAPGGGKLVCSEEVTLIARGDGALHIPAVVRALLVANVPTMMLLNRPPRLASAALRALLPECDRLIINTNGVATPRDLTLLGDLATSVGQVVDLGWLSLAGIRNSLAAVFDHREPREALRSLRGIYLECPSGRLANRLVLLGWLATRLGLSGPPRLTSTDGVRSVAWKAQHGDVTMRVLPRERGADGAEAETLLELNLGAQTVKLRRGTDPIALIETAHGVRRMALDPSTLGERLARGMGPRVPDPAYADVFARAREMAR